MNKGDELSVDLNSGPRKRKPQGLRKSLGRSPSAGISEAPLGFCQRLKAAQSPAEKLPCCSVLQ